MKPISSNYPHRVCRHWAAPGVALAALALFQPWLEATMPRHMGLEIPLIFIIGWYAASVAGERLVRMLAPWNMAGVPALTYAMLVMSVWMVPSALDFAVLSPVVAMAKVVSIVTAGMLAGASWRSAGIVIQAFFVLNGFWTTFVVGMLYRDAPQQLCSVYLADDQALAGMAMMQWAVLGLALWAPGVLRQLRQWDRVEAQRRETAAVGAATKTASADISY